MSYYQGDFYQGDPGFFSFLGKGLKLATGMIPGVGGIAAKAVSHLLPAGSKAGALVTRATGAMMKHPTLTAAGGAGLIAAGGAGVGRMTARTGASAVGPLSTQRGFHVAKAGRHAGMLVRNRRMRVTNPKALRRAIRRCAGFAHLAKRVLRFTSPRPPKGRPIFKHRRRRKTV